MSADNWTICPDCQKRIKTVRDAFIKKYYGKLDAFVYESMLNEINIAIKHMESYDSDEHEPNTKILKLMEDRNIIVTIDDEDFNASEILCCGMISCSLREDYESGVDNVGNIYFNYSCECNCGFSKCIDFDENEHKIIKKDK